MIDLKATRKRMNKALDSYTNYAQHMHMHGKNAVIIQRKETYRVDLEKLSCTCADYQFHGSVSLCKHFWLAVMFANSVNHDAPEGSEPL